MTREYVQVTPSRSDLAPGTVVEQLGALHALDSNGGGFLAGLDSLGEGGPPTFEFLAISAGSDEPVEFYYGSDRRLDAFEERLRTLYPSTFVVERAQVDPVARLVPEERIEDCESDVLDEFEPRGVRWVGDAIRTRDWMTTIPAFTDTVGQGDDHSRAPLAPLIDRLTAADHPIAFQVLFERKPDWTADARARERRLRDGEDRLFDRFLSELFVGAETDGGAVDADEFQDPGGRERVASIETKRPGRTFTTNLRALALVPEERDEDEEDDAAIDRLLDDLVPTFDHLSGTHYGVSGRRLRDSWLEDRRATRAFARFREREITTSRWGSIRPDLVLNADELANVTVVPPATQLTTEGGRGAEANPESRSPLPRPTADHMDQFREGMAIGYALDENGEPEDDPTRVPPDLLTTHYLRAATTGAGKSKALVNDALSLYEETDGPIVLIDPKGDGMSENFMRAHAARFGADDLAANVLHFPVPEVLPGFSFFNIERDLAAGRARVDAVQNVADHYEEILKLAMGEDRYEQAIVAPNLIKYLVKALFDEEYGRENGLYRESVDYFAHTQLEHVLDQLWAAGPPDGDVSEAPQASQNEVQRKINRQLELDSNTFATVMGGVSNRLDYVTQDAHLRRIFDNTEPRFDFRDVLDENTVVLFDLGDLRDEAARLMTGVILTNLEDALETRDRTVDELPDDYVVNLLVDEAASVVVSDVMNDLLEKGRSFGLSVGLSLQFPEQIEAEGDHQVYLNVLNDVATTLVGKIAVDREIARAMAHEEMDPAAFANRIRSLPRGEWIAQLPSPTFGETGPEPFSLEPLPIPDGHPESDDPLDRHQERQFADALEQVHKRTAAEYGVPEDGDLPVDRTPDAVREILGADDGGLDRALASAIRIVQIRTGEHETNGWVPVADVDDELRACYDAAEVEEPPPEYETLADVRERSRLIDVDLDDSGETVVAQLTDAGEDAVAIDTGDVRAAGGDRHDAMLAEIEQALTPLGFTVTIEEQDGADRPDAKAFHPDLDIEFYVEAETTTPDKPAKVLRNFRRAQDDGYVPLFVVETGVESVTHWAERLDGILNPPVKRRTGGETHFYITDESITFGGGARAEGGATAVRPVTDGSRRTVWVEDGSEFVLRDGDGTDHARVDDPSDPSKDRFPALYSYDPGSGEFTVREHGETHVYDSRDAFKADWVRVRRPFVPAIELGDSAFGPETYATVIVPGDGGDLDEPVVYEDGAIRSLDTLTEFETGTADSAEEGDRWADLADDPDAAIGVFAAERLREDGDATVTTAAVYDAYCEWAEDRGLPVESKNWFARRLSNHVSFERTAENRDGTTVRCYVGIDLQEGSGNASA